jgi:Fic family protein
MLDSSRPASEVVPAMSDLEKFLHTAGRTARILGLSVPTVNAAVARLEEAGILREVTGRKRGRVFVYHAYLALLQAEQ